MSDKTLLDTAPSDPPPAYDASTAAQSLPEKSRGTPAKGAPRQPFPLELPALVAARGKRTILASQSPRRKQLLAQVRPLNPQRPLTLFVSPTYLAQSSTNHPPHRSASPTSKQSPPTTPKTFPSPSPPSNTFCKPPPPNASPSTAPSSTARKATRNSSSPRTPSSSATTGASSRNPRHTASTWRC